MHYVWLLLLSVWSLVVSAQNNTTLSEQQGNNFGNLTFYDTRSATLQDFYLLNFGSEQNSANSNDTGATVNSFNFITFSDQQLFSLKNGTNNLIYNFNNSFAQLLHDVDMNSIQFYGDHAILFTANDDNSLQYLDLNSLEQYTVFNDASVTGIYVFNDTAYFNYDNMISSWDGSNLRRNFLQFNNGSHVENIHMINSTNMLISGKFNSLLNISGDKTNETIFNGLPVTLYEASWKSSGNIDPTHLICPNEGYTDNSWLITNSTRGEFNIDLKYAITPTKLRIYNSHDLNSAISLFRVITYPAGGIMNMTYLDSNTKKLSSCDAFCPLYSLSNLQNGSSLDPVSTDDTNLTYVANTKSYQEFAFASPISVQSIEFIAMDSFGENVGLNAIEIYANSFTVFANDTYNLGSCSQSKTYVSSNLSNNNWTTGSINDTYLRTNYIPGDDPVPKVTYKINIENSGDYSIFVYTPGCLTDNSCNSRGIVNITIYDSMTHNIIKSSLIYQNNEYLKYDNLFYGHLNNSISIQLGYSSGLYSDNTLTAVVADRIDVQISKIDETQSNDNVVLNGLLTFLVDTRVIDISDNMNQLAVNAFQYDATLLSTIVNDTILVTDQTNTLIIMSLSDTNNYFNMTTNGNIKQLEAYSNGVCVLTDADIFYLYYDDNLHLIDNVINASLTTVHNITINGLEYLVFNDNYIYNLTSSTFLTQDDQISYLAMNAGDYNGIGTIFNGDIAYNQFTNLNASIMLDWQKNNVQSINNNPYDAIFFNDSLSGFFQYHAKDESTRLYWNNSLYSGLQWDGNVTSTLYDSNGTILFVASNGTLSIVNLTTMKTLKDVSITMGKSSKKMTSLVNGMVYLPQNKSVIVGGANLNQDCSTLCLYNYQKDKWNNLNNDNITGIIDNLYVYKNDTMILQGNITVNDESNIQLSWFNITSKATTPVITEDSSNHIDLSGLQVYNDIIVGWNNTMLFTYTQSNDTWSLLPISGISSESVVNTVEIIETGNDSMGIMVVGELYDSNFGHLQSVTYDFQDWSPFFYTSGQYQPQQSRLFMNRDISTWQLLQDPFSIQANDDNDDDSGTSTGSSNFTGTPTIPGSSDHNKGARVHTIKRGYIVLIGLALSLATISVLGLLGVLIAYVFKDGNSTNYQTMNPVVDENKMVDTLPPEKIRDFM